MNSDARSILLLLVGWCLGGAGAVCSAQNTSPIDTLVEGAKLMLGGGALPPAETVATPQADGPRFELPVAQIDPEAPIDIASRNGLVSLTVNGASLRQVLSVLAETQGFNLIMASPGDAPVTAKFERLPVFDVLESLLASTGHTWTKHNEIIFVTSSTTTDDLAPHVQGRRMVVLELDFASAADLQPTVEGLLSSVGQSFFVETNPADNRRTKELLIVEDLEPYLLRIEQYVAEADQPPRQVLIEVHLLQVNLDDDQRCGVNLDALSRVSGASLSLRSAGLANAAAAPGFFIESTGGDLDAVIEALITTKDAKSLAAPRLLALNGQMARMQIGERLGYRVTTTTETSSLESVDFLDVGVVLSVTPRITRDGRVLMRIRPEVSTGAVNPDTGVPDSETTELETDVLLTSGQGMIIGGLIQERDDTSIARVPVLGSIPYAGFLFQRRQVTKIRNELIVALVPHVLPYEPIQAERNRVGVARAFDPLTHGPLCRYPRPYEPRMYDPHVDRPRLHCLDRRDQNCPDGCLPSYGAPGSASLRRLPAVSCGDVLSPDEPTLAEPIADRSVTPATLHR